MSKVIWFYVQFFAVLCVSFRFQRTLFFRSDKLILKMNDHGSSIRPLGGYERLLARRTPGVDSVSLSHGAVFLIQKAYSNDDLVQAVATCMER